MGQRTRSTRLRYGMARTLAMAYKESLHLVRDPRSLFLALGMPVVLIFIFGYGVSFDLDHVPLAVADQDRTAMSRDLVTRLAATGEFDLVRVDETGEAADGLFRRREAAALVVIPPTFSTDRQAGRPGFVQAILDGTDGTSAGSILATLTRIVSETSTLPRPFATRVRTLFNPELRSAVFLVPGLVAYLLSIAGVLLTALTIAREWERGNLEQLFATPVGRIEIILGKLLPFFAVGLLQALLVLTVGCTVFDVPIRGSLGLLTLGTLLFLAGALAQGVLVSVVTRSQQVATQVGAITSILPGILLSGFLFPLENMPLWLQALSFLFPARYYVDLLRGVMLKDASMSALWPDLAGMLAFAVVVVTLSTLRFRRRLA